MIEIEIHTKVYIYVYINIYIYSDQWKTENVIFQPPHQVKVRNSLPIPIHHSKDNVQLKYNSYRQLFIVLSVSATRLSITTAGNLYADNAVKFAGQKPAELLY